MLFRSTMEMVDPDTGEIISQHNAAADPASYKNAKGTKAPSASAFVHQMLPPSVVHHLAALLALIYTAVHNWR